MKEHKFNPKNWKAKNLMDLGEKKILREIHHVIVAEKWASKVVEQEVATKESTCKALEHNAIIKKKMCV